MDIKIEVQYQDGHRTLINHTVEDGFNFLKYRDNLGEKLAEGRDLNLLSNDEMIKLRNREISMLRIRHPEDKKIDALTKATLTAKVQPYGRINCMVCDGRLLRHEDYKKHIMSKSLTKPFLVLQNMEGGLLCLNTSVTSKIEIGEVY